MKFEMQWCYHGIYSHGSHGVLMAFMVGALKLGLDKKVYNRNQCFLLFTDILYLAGK